MVKTIFSFLLLLLVSRQVLSQQFDTTYQKQWLEIDTLISKRDLTQTALEKIKQLRQQARQEHKTVQSARCLLYAYNLSGKVSADEVNPVFKDIRQEISSSNNEAAKALLHTLLAKLYQGYFRQQMYRLYQRPATTGGDKTDISTWGTDDFHTAIRNEYKAALANKQVLQQEPVERYAAIIIAGNQQQLRPSLYDLLAQDALGYYTTEQQLYARTAFYYPLSDERLFGSIPVFLPTVFSTNDSSSPKWISLQLYQELMRFHQREGHQQALLAVNLERLQWAYRESGSIHKERLYKEALEELTRSYPDNHSTATAWYLLAQMEMNLAQNYQPGGDSTQKMAYARAGAIAEKALRIFTEPCAATANLKNLLVQIQLKELSCETEQANIPGKPFRALVHYRNIDTVYTRIIPVDYNRQADKNQWNTNAWKEALAIKPIRSSSQWLPAASDHQRHAVEIKIDALPIGDYAIILSGDPAFSEAKSNITIQHFAVTNISFIRNRGDYFVLNRETGKPIQDVKVRIIKQVFISRTQKNIGDTVATRVTDKNGYFSFISNTYSAFHYLFQSANDHFISNIADYNSPGYDGATEEDGMEKFSSQIEKQSARVYFFTDRSMYRPGQFLYFKGIAITRDAKTKLSKLITGDSGTVYLLDVNRKRTDSLKVKLNEYGSFAGRFVLPQQTLTGVFTIEYPSINYSSATVSVEEYKRPVFTAQFETVKTTYRLNDDVAVNGNVTAFAGNQIDGAKVSYRIVRNTSFTGYYDYRRPYPSFPQREIGSGETQTNAQGKFTIRFKTDASDLANQTDNLLLQFTITATVTDANGETHAASTSLKASAQSLLLQLVHPAVMEADSLKKIFIRTSNFSNQPDTAMVQVKILSLQTPKRLIRKRYWQKPDQFVYSKEQFLTWFPNDEYDDESNYNAWLAANTVSEATVASNAKEGYTISSKPLPAGYYRIEAVTHDTYGVEIKQYSYIQVFSKKQNALPLPSYDFFFQKEFSAEPGTNTAIWSGSSADNLFVISQTHTSSQKNTPYIFRTLKAGLQDLSYTPLEADRGITITSYVYVINNRVYQKQYQVLVPWNNKNLKVQYATYRDKTEPGSQEQWTVTVSGNKGEKVAAELLTGMYDASLDQFRNNTWMVPPVWGYSANPINFDSHTNFLSQSGIPNTPESEGWTPVPEESFDRIAANSTELINRDIAHWMKDSSLPLSRFTILNFPKLDESVLTGDRKTFLNGKLSGVTAADYPNSRNTVAIRGNTAYEQTLAKQYAVAGNFSSNAAAEIPGMQVRKNFAETAFFFPQLQADTAGNYSFSFTMPDALTRWKWMSLAHTKDLSFGSFTATIITQKKLMVQPNAPRFLREGDNMEFSSKLVNMSDKEITGQVSLELMDATTGSSVDGWFQNIFPSQYFTIEAGQSFAVKFPIQVPFSFNRPLTWRIKATAGEYSDAEENNLPVLTNRTLVTETLPLFLGKDTTQHFVFDNLINNNSESLTNESLTIDYSSNPAWNAVQALPYLMEYPYECAEQTFNRLYANTLASWMLNREPRMRQLLDAWRKDSSLFKSSIEKNPELKQVLLQETPWVLEAASEEQQRKNISQLFDLDRIAVQTKNTLEKLEQMQLPDGAFPWFSGGNADSYITQYILTGIGKLKRLGALSPEISSRFRAMLVKAIQYMDRTMNEEYQSILRSKTTAAAPSLSGNRIGYMYMRSFFRDLAQPYDEAYRFFYNLAKRQWTEQNHYYQAELGTVFFRNGDEKIATQMIAPALLENTVTGSTQGLYWKNNFTRYWYQSPIEYQAMMISFFSELNQDKKDPKTIHQIDAMKTWLVLHKETNHWQTTIATADACYALLLNGSNWLSARRTVNIQMGKNNFGNTTEKTTAGTGYFKKRIEGKMVSNDMGHITVSVKTEKDPFDKTPVNSIPSYGAVYWQYFEDMDKITPGATPLSVVKKLFTEQVTDKGPVLRPLEDGAEVKPGDKIVVQLELHSDRDMDYLHLKDLRASSMEPVNVLSGYKWQDGLGYYESTKDVSSNFFIDHLKKGTYVFRYAVYATHTGQFTAGIATIQSMYAPEFSSHSVSLKIRVSN